MEKTINYILIKITILYKIIMNINTDILYKVNVI